MAKNSSRRAVFTSEQFKLHRHPSNHICTTTMATPTPTKPRAHTARRHCCPPATLALFALVVASVFVAAVDAVEEVSPSAADGKGLVLTGGTVAFVLNDGSHATVNLGTFLKTVGCIQFLSCVSSGFSLFSLPSNRGGGVKAGVRSGAVCVPQ